MDGRVQRARLRRAKVTAKVEGTAEGHVAGGRHFHGHLGLALPLGVDRE